MGLSASGSPERWHRVARILDEVLELTPELRPAFLERACADDVGLRAEVDALLIGAAAEDFLATCPSPLPGLSSSRASRDSAASRTTIRRGTAPSDTVT